MRRINYLFLALFATLAFAACSDDDDDDDKNGETELEYCTIDQDPTEDECKPFCDNPENADHEECEADDGFIAPDPAKDLCKGQEAEYAAIESKITDIATTAAFACGGTSVNAENADEVAELNACVSLNIAETDDVEITAECAYCTARVVACAVSNCIGDCASDSGSEACLECRAEHACEEGMDECQGFGEEQEEVYCSDDQDPEADDCVINCEEDDTHESCEEEVDYCSDDQDEEEDDCVIDCEEDASHSSCD